MTNEDCRNGARPTAEDGNLEQPCEGSEGAADAVDPRILTIARAIGRLIAREQFKELERPTTADAQALRTPEEMAVMTTKTSQTGVDGISTANWTVAEAKARFSKLIELAQSKGPQTITKHGRAAVVVVSVKEWERKLKRTGNLAEFFAASPLRDSGLEIKRRKDRPRKVDL